MCTVSWLPAPDGYFLCCNRDERFTRAPALPPAVRERDGVCFLAPLDGDAGGTWLVANEHGVTVTLLNRYHVPGYRPPAAPRSRGLLVLDLASARTGAEAAARLVPSLLAVTQPFTLVLAEPGQAATIASWDGLSLGLERQASAGLLRTSSSVTEPEVAESRRRLFAALDRVTPGALAALHRSHDPARGKLSVCMHRGDAETQASSRIEVTGQTVRLDHAPGAPCRTEALPALELARRPLPYPIPG